MAEKGYNSIDEFKNKLKEWSKEGVALSREARMKKKAAGTITTAAAVNGSASASSGMDNVMLTALLMVAIAVLLADKMDVISI
jgi:hypothetical protein